MYAALPIGRERGLSDDALDQLARELFAEVRAQHCEKPSRKPARMRPGVSALTCWVGDDDAGDGGDSG